MLLPVTPATPEAVKARSAPNAKPPVAVDAPPPVAVKPPVPAPVETPPPDIAKPPAPAVSVKSVSSIPASRHWRPEPAAKERLPKPKPPKDSSPDFAASDLPLVPTDLGQKSPGTGPVSPPAPGPFDIRESDYAPHDVPSFFARRRVLLAALALTLIAAAVTAFLRQRPSSPPPKAAVAAATPKPVAVAGPESTPVATKRFWDQMQEIACAGLQQAQSIPFGQYPVMSSGIYDFQLIDDNALDALMNSLTTRSRGLAHVSEQIALLDKTNVDADLVAYGKKLSEHWQRAASLDSDAINVVWAVHERRARPAATATPALESADVVPTESHAPGATPVTMDHVSQLANGWLAQRNYFVQVGLQVDASEKEIYQKLAARYKDQFK